MIILRNIKKYYTLGNESIEVLKGVSLHLQKGQLICLLGESGCGKSTLLNIIGGLDYADDGEYIFQSINVRKFNEKEWACLRREKIGFVFQSFNLIPHLSALENVEMSMTLLGKSKEERKRRAIELLNMVGLEDKLNYLPNQLSGGQKQRVAIARALANDPDIILADEPTGALDSENSVRIMEILKKISQQGKVVLVVTHSQELVSFADRIIRMRDGKIIENEDVAHATEVEDVDKSIGNKSKKLDLFTTCKLSFRNIKNKKWRNILTAIGASIGIFGLSIIMALGNGVKQKLSSSIDEATAKSSLSVANEQFAVLSENDSAQLRELKGVRDIYPYNPFQISIKTKEGAKATSSAESLSPRKYAEIIYGKKYIVKGRFPDDQSDEIVLPERIAKKLFKDSKEAVGKHVSLVVQVMSLKEIYPTVNVHATVVGVVKNNPIPLLDTVGISYGLSQKIMQESIGNSTSALSFTIIPSSMKDIAPLKNEIKKMGYKVQTDEESQNEINEYISLASIALGMLSGISLIVSSIMIGIVLYVSVLERTREIGILKALGAFRSDIRRIFVTEGMLIGVIGGVFGILGSIAVGKAANYVVTTVMKKSNLDLFQFSFVQVVLLILFSGLLGVLASFVPANKAAKQPAVEALRHE
ncbi:ATP-binding cassette domain-containing protein [Geobacillus sp. TFV-3]|uniref:ABC transporter ATP-binding protein/permease n=1 Tax=Geobacillus sp. TFV-3 TaxID=1897059 RepID=UPI001359A8A1|nr:ABC transporter ATP-binding protein/permease [Geobacillus sp. TFV-3]KAF0996550.1 Macrolide export ATP-binding/permease protein MacB [Geobacillus sp. TFV-3]